MNQERCPVPDVLGARTRHRWSAANVRGALWARRALKAASVDLSAVGMRTVVVAPPQLPPGATRGVIAVLQRTGPTCLERAVVLQRWLAAQGADHDVIVGVARQDGAVVAHAWLDFERPVSAGVVFEELARRPAQGLLA